MFFVELLFDLLEALLVFVDRYRYVAGFMFCTFPELNCLLFIALCLLSQSFDIQNGCPSVQYTALTDPPLGSMISYKEEI